MIIPHGIPDGFHMESIWINLGKVKTSLHSIIMEGCCAVLRPNGYHVQVVVVDSLEARAVSKNHPTTQRAPMIQRGHG